MLNHRLSQLVNSLLVTLFALWRLCRTAVREMMRRLAEGSRDRVRTSPSESPVAPNAADLLLGRKLQPVRVPIRPDRCDPGPHGAR